MVAVAAVVAMAVAVAVEALVTSKQPGSVFVYFSVAFDGSVSPF